MFHNVIQVAAGESQGDKAADGVGSIDPGLLLAGILIQKHSIRSVMGILLLDHILDCIKLLERSYELFRSFVAEKSEESPDHRLRVLSVHDYMINAGLAIGARRERFHKTLRLCFLG